MVDPSSQGFVLDDSLLPEEYANPNGSAWVDSYVLQAAPGVQNGRVALKVAEVGNYSTAIDSVALGLVGPSAQALYTEEGSSALLGVSSAAPVVAAHDENGINVTSLLSDPLAASSTSASSFYQGSSGDVVVAGFGSVAQASQDVLLLRTAGDPGFPPTGPSGVSVSVQNPSSGVFTSVGFVAPRVLFGTEALPLASVLPAGTQPVVVRLVWQGDHSLAWLALGDGVSAVTPAPATLVSAISGGGSNWTSLLAYTDGNDAYFLPGANATVTFGLPFAPPAGSSFVVITDGAPWTTPVGAPQSSFVDQPTVPVTNATVTFTSTSYDNSSALVAYNWSFGDGTWGSGSVAGHVYAVPGPYNVTLTVTDAAGLTSAATSTIFVYPGWDWQSPQPKWGSGNLCTVQTKGSTETCQNSRSNQCDPWLQYNFSRSNTTFALSLSGSNNCGALNFLGDRDTIYLNLSGSNWKYLDVAVAGSLDRVFVDTTGSSNAATLVLYGRGENYTLSSSGSHNDLRTYLVSVDLPADAAPYGHAAHTDEESLSATGSNNEQNITWVDFPGARTAPHTTPMPGKGRSNEVSWANTTVFPASWASPLNSSCTAADGFGHSPPNCCGWGSGQGNWKKCCWDGQGNGWGRCCWGGWGEGPDHGCCWAPATPDHGCHGDLSAGIPALTPVRVPASSLPHSLVPGAPLIHSAATERALATAQGARVEGTCLGSFPRPSTFLFALP